MLNFCSVVVLQRSIVNWRRGALVYVHFAISETDLVQCYSIDLWSIGGGGLYVKLMQCSGIPYIYGQLEDGTSYISVHFILKK